MRIVEVVVYESTCVAGSKIPDTAMFKGHKSVFSEPWEDEAGRGCVNVGVLQGLEIGVYGQACPLAHVSAIFNILHWIPPLGTCTRLDKTALIIHTLPCRTFHRWHFDIEAKGDLVKGTGFSTRQVI